MGASIITARKPRMQWYDHKNAGDRTEALLRNLRWRNRSVSSATFAAVKWLVMARWGRTRTAPGRVVTKELALFLVSDQVTQQAFDSAVRLKGARSAAAWLLKLHRASRPRLTAEERLARAAAAIAARTSRREAHARAMLAKHQAALLREKNAVRKWAAKVKRYDKKNEVRGGEG